MESRTIRYDRKRPQFSRSKECFEARNGRPPCCAALPCHSQPSIPHGNVTTSVFMICLLSLVFFGLASVRHVVGLSCLSVKSKSTAKESCVVSRRGVLLPLVAVSPVFLGFESLALALDLSEYQDGPSGLKFKVMDPGTGEKPQRGQKVKTSYKLFLNGFDQDSGELIDSSNGLFGESPFEFVVGVGQVVRGWDLALMDMKEREARRLVIPPELGYGAKGAGGRIPGGATLFFEVRLTELGKKLDFNEDQLKWLEEHPL